MGGEQGEVPISLPTHTSRKAPVKKHDQSDQRRLSSGAGWGLDRKRGAWVRRSFSEKKKPKAGSQVRLCPWWMCPYNETIHNSAPTHDCLPVLK